MDETSAPCVLVCVTDQLNCKNHIKMGRRLADENNMALEVLNIQPEGNAFKPCSEELQYLFNVVKENDAGMTVYYNDEAPLMAVAHIRKCNAEILVTGLPNQFFGFVEVVRFLAPDVQINMLSLDGTVNVLEARVNKKV